MNLFDKFDQTLAGNGQTETPALAGATLGAPIKTKEEIESEWLKKRWGKFTASEVYKLMTCENQDGLPKGAMSYVVKKAAESLTDFTPEPYMNAAMQWGIDHEPEAVDAFMALTGLTVTHCKDGQEFIDGGHVGGTPDGIIPSEFSGLEIKCPNSDTHLSYLQVKTGADLKAEAVQYYWQVQCLMMLTQSLHWYFVSYDPRFIDERLRLHIAMIEASAKDIAKLRERLNLADEYKKNMVESISK